MNKRISSRNLKFSMARIEGKVTLPLEPGTIIDQTPRGGERVDCGTVIGVTMSGEDPGP